MNRIAYPRSILLLAILLSGCGRGINILTVTAVSPSTVLWSGGTWIDIYGTRFTNGSKAYINGVECNSTERVSTQHIRCLPRYTAPTVATVNVVSGGGETYSLSQAVSFVGTLALSCTSTASVYLYRVDSSSGALTQTGTQPSVNASALEFDPLNRHFSQSTASDLRMFSVNPQTLSISPTGAGYTSIAGPADIAYSPSGSALYVSAGGAASLGVHTVLDSLGTLSAVSNVTAPTSPTNPIGVNAQGSVLVAGDGTNIRSWSISTGAPYLTDTGYTVAIGSPGTDFLFHPSAPILLAMVTSNIKRYWVQPTTGQITSIGADVGNTNSVVSAVFSPNGSQLFVGSTTDVRAYLVNTDGTVSANGSLPVTSLGQIAIDATGKFLYVLKTTSIDLVPIQSNGTLGTNTMAVSGMCTTAQKIAASH